LNLKNHACARLAEGKARAKPALPVIRRSFGGINMIGIKEFIEIRERFGHFASWAVWADEGVNPKENIDDLSVLNPDVNPSLLKILHGNAILLGLNISRRIERPLGNFHDPRPIKLGVGPNYLIY
jgi:hypothetical protein